MNTQLLFIILVGSLMVATLNAGPGQDPTGDHSAYEAITGESAEEDKTVWDTFYRSKSFIYGRDAVSFLKEKIHEIPKGRAFVPAMGEGRNAVFLAKKGFQVEGVDISEVAVEKALLEAKKAKVQIKATTADLNQFEYKENYYDLVVISLFYSKPLMKQFKAVVKKGGYILFYNKIRSQTGTNKSSMDAFSVLPLEVKESLNEFEIKSFKEYTDRGLRVVGILARKK